ncbi:hypothetical protein [Clostridium sardiniense]|uniref:hypothetical protein n=1 Tax=Clostridium sardiniense TaxID=29369 RepID=UPI001959BE6F|nr:hypothetical protein [Clostridium sardiniense]MBM7836444.1 uncharacterized protein YoxC [Clostridium sardiniense]
MADVLKLGGSFDLNVNDVVGELDKLDKKFNETSKASKSTATDVKGYGSSLDSLKIKQAELSNKLKTQTMNLQQLSAKFKETNSSLLVLKRSNGELEQRIQKTNNELNDAVRKYGSNSNEAKELRAKLETLRQEYENNSKAIDSNIQKLESYSLKMDSAENNIQRTRLSIQQNNEAISNTGGTFDRISGKLNDFSNKLSGLGTKLFVGATLPIIGVGTASFKTASDLNENMNKAEVVFDKNADAVKKWSETSLDAMGMSQSSALEMASHFGDMSVSMGLTNDQTMKYSESLTQLAADLASFKNISIDQASTALTGVYTGETEALKGLGVVMTQTNLQQFAQSQGIKKKIQDMTQAEQVQLRYNYVMSKTKDAQGDFSRTGDQAANASRKFHESLSQLMAVIGNNLLPIFTPFINKANELIVKFSQMSPATQKIIISIAGFIAVLGPAFIFLGKFVGGINKSITALVKFPGQVKKGIDGVKNFGKGVKDGTNLIGKFGRGLISCVKSIGNFTLSLIKATVKGIGNFIKGIGKCILAIGKFTLSLIKNTAIAIKNGAVWLANKIKLLAYKTAQLAVTAATKAMTLAQKALNLAMRMNPIGLVITILLALAAVFVTLYNKCEWFRDGVNQVWSFIKGLFSGFSNFLKGVFSTDWTQSFGAFGNIINAFMHNVQNVWDSIKRIFGGIIDFIAGVFQADWSRAWEGVKNIFGGIMDGLGAVMKAPLNGVIGLINMAIDGINSISFTAPSWIPFVGGQHFGVNLPKINYLYKGGIFTQPTLLGPNTVVGDKYKGQGSNPEAVIPLDKLWEKLDAIANRPIKLIADGREFALIVAKHQKTIDGYNDGRTVITR